jgi:hypothetical protein
MSAERVMMLTAKLYGAREAVHFLFEDEYAEKIAPYRQIVLAATKKFNCNVLEAVPKIIDAERRDGHEIDGVPVLCLMAAAVDLAEGM